MSPYRIPGPRPPEPEEVVEWDPVHIIYKIGAILLIGTCEVLFGLTLTTIIWGSLR